MNQYKDLLITAWELEKELVSLIKELLKAKFPDCPSVAINEFESYFECFETKKYIPTYNHIYKTVVAAHDRRVQAVKDGES